MMMHRLQYGIDLKRWSSCSTVIRSWRCLFFVSTVLICCSLSTTNAAVVSTATAALSSFWCDEDHEDYVNSLPGYIYQQPPSCWYSGYVTYELIPGTTIHTHYTLQIAESTQMTAVSTKETTKEDDQDDSESNPFQKPLIYWSNGGPGASSMFGLLTELGNLLFSEDSLKTEEYRTNGNIPTPLYNPHAWTRIGHLLSFDQPAPIGFSYCTNTTDTDIDPNTISNPHSCNGIKWNDELTSQAAYMAMMAFYNKFPLFYNLDLYLTGESYAGIYIPTLAREIVRHNAILNQTSILPLRGFAVGDGCLGTHTGICGIVSSDYNMYDFDIWNVLFLAGHGQIPMSTLNMIMNACTNNHTTEGNDDFVATYLRNLQRVGQLSSTSKQSNKNSLSCTDALKVMDEQAGGVYAYGLYDDCTYSNGIKRTRTYRSKMIKGGVNDYACGGDIVMMDYLSRPDVRQALHVTKEDFFSVDNAEGDFDYTPTEPDISGFYKEMNGKLRMLVYNGDTDPAINSFAAQNWTSHLGLQEIQAWRPWTVDGCRRMGGYVTRYENNFDFLTIRGAGHMVPTNKAEAAFTFIKAWIDNKDYPIYDKNCSFP